LRAGSQTENRWTLLCMNSLKKTTTKLLYIYWKYERKRIFCFGSTGVWTQGFLLARKVFYYLSQAPSLFALIMFEIWSYFMIWLTLPQSSYSHFPHTWDDKCEPQWQAYWMRCALTLFAQADLELWSSQSLPLK
jgi:hypothetical protein